MKPRTINCALTLCLTMLFTTYPQNSHADRNHPFYHDVKEAYRDSKLMYDSKVEQVLYSMMPEPKDMFEKSGHGTELPKPRNIEEEEIMLQTIEALFIQFFRKVKTGGQYCPVEKIKKHFGQTPKERIGISSGGYYRLFVSYWTLNVKLEENRKNNILKHGYGNVYCVDSLLRFVESDLAGAFFPTSDLSGISEGLRRQAIQELLKRVAPTMTVEELFEGADSERVEWPVLKAARPQIFSHEKKINLIRQLVKKRIDNDRLLKEKYAGRKVPNVNDLPEMLLLGLPEATIVTIVESYWMMKNRTTRSDKAILESIENHRQTDSPELKPMPSPLTLSNYIKYRLNIEHSQGVPISNEYVEEAIETANEAYR